MSGTLDPCQSFQCRAWTEGTEAIRCLEGLGAVADLIRWRHQRREAIEQLPDLARILARLEEEAAAITDPMDKHLMEEKIEMIKQLRNVLLQDAA